MFFNSPSEYYDLHVNSNAYGFGRFDSNTRMPITCDRTTRKNRSVRTCRVSPTGFARQERLPSLGVKFAEVVNKTIITAIPQRSSAGLAFVAQELDILSRFHFYSLAPKVSVCSPFGPKSAANLWAMFTRDLTDRVRIRVTYAVTVYRGSNWTGRILRKHPSDRGRTTIEYTGYNLT